MKTPTPKMKVEAAWSKRILAAALALSATGAMAGSWSAVASRAASMLTDLAPLPSSDDVSQQYYNTKMRSAHHGYKSVAYYICGKRALVAPAGTHAAAPRRLTNEMMQTNVIMEDNMHNERHFSTARVLLE